MYKNDVIFANGKIVVSSCFRYRGDREGPCPIYPDCWSENSETYSEGMVSGCSLSHSEAYSYTVMVQLSVQETIPVHLFNELKSKWEVLESGVE